MAQRIVLGITGASGACYARRLVELLVAAEVEVHLVVSPPGVRLLHDELGMEGVDPEALAGRGDHTVTLHHYRDVGDPLASGSFLHDGMIVAPCSSHTLGAIASGLGENLLHRAAAVCLKERRPLLLLHRESPLSLIEIQNMERATLAGATVVPASPGFYMLPETIGDVVDFVVGRLLDLVKVEHTLHTRWTESEANWKSVPRE